MKAALAVRFEGDASSEERRRLLLDALLDEGAFIVKNDVHGYRIAIVLPGETEVPRKDSVKIYAAVVDALARAIETMQFLHAQAIKASAGEMVKGGEA